MLEALLRAGGGRLRGIRNATASHPDKRIRSGPYDPPAHMLLSESFQRGVRHLAPLQLSLDIWAFHTQLNEVQRLAQAFSDTLIVLDHLGGPLGVGPHAGRRAEVFTDWMSDMRALAACQNVHVKLGGLAMRVGGFDFHEQPEPPSSPQLADAFRPYIDGCIELFGVNRCMFESNFPVDKSMVGYAVLWNAFKRLSAGYSSAEKEALFSGTAARVYRLTDIPGTSTD